ncbi:radical SAM protein [Candidatus Woesearchaeota archaeon]|nr:radical SAM protein [Candidatus Woesearchaeota archaeon]
MRKITKIKTRKTMKKRKTRKIRKTKYHSRLVGKLPKGCRQCVRGEKLVMFVTGVCPRNCYYCPVSEKKRFKDVTYANEWEAGNEDEKKMINSVIKEAELCNSKGMGMTGGDPLARIDRTARLIRAMKRRFGKEFHVHLYTSPVSVTTERLDKLHKARLDEIRLHLDLYDKVFWNRLDLVNKYDWDTGIEIPVIPGQEEKIIEMVKYIRNKVKFLNLNEFEISEDNIGEFLKRGLLTKNKVSYAVKGSEESAKKVLKYCAENTKLDVHYCTAKLKDKVQMTERIKRRAKNAKRRFDVMLEDGILYRGAFYPGSIKSRFHAIDLPKLRKAMVHIKKRYEIPNGMIELDQKRARILTSPLFIKELGENKEELGKIKKLGLIPALIKEYPTEDAFIVELVKY